MTKRQPDLDEETDRGLGGEGTTVHESSTVQERLVQRTCGWCGVPVTYTGVGRPPRYCSAAHKRRASELRRALERAELPVDEGGQTAEPVREVVERTTVITRVVRERSPNGVVPAARLNGEPYTLPADAIEWLEALGYLRSQVAAGRLPAFTREGLARACDLTARVLRAAPKRLP